MSHRSIPLLKFRRFLSPSPSVNFIWSMKLYILIPDNGAWVEIARFYGDGAILTQAVEAGFDPLSVELIDAPAKVQGSKGENSHHFLSLAQSTISVQFCRFSKLRLFSLTLMISIRHGR
jgi:hypothetical protein